MTSKSINFGKRSLIQINESYFLAIPKAWIRTNSLSKGNLLGVSSQDNKIIVEVEE
jgi:hypothetical protein